ncbi:MAG: hypothetical protein M1319_02095 [Chloroflexi bacterium]|nr:hypothetical protein [Chloroflexota bacterium]
MEAPESAKERIHSLVEQLPESQLDAAERVLAYLKVRGEDHLLQALVEAPEDDEIAGAEEDRAADEAWAEYCRGEGRTWEDVRRELADE